MERRSSPSVRVFYPKYDTQGLVEAIRQGTEILREVLPVKLVVLFGSCATGDHTVASDVDLLVVYGGDHRRDAYGKVREAMGIRQLEPHVYTEAEYNELRKTIDRMTGRAKVIYEEAQSN